MNAFLRLVLTHLRGFRRDRAAFFFSFIFPLFFILIFGAFFGSDRPRVPRYKVGLIREDVEPASAAFIDGLKQIPILDLQTGGTRTSEFAALSQGERRAVVVIPKNFSRAFAGQGSAALEVRYDESQPQVWQTIQFALAQSVMQAQQSALLTRQAPQVTIAAKPARRESSERRPIDTMLPGIIAMSIMQLGLFSALPIVRERESGILKRIGATPLPRSTYLASQVTFRVLVGLLQTGLLILTGAVLFKVRFGGSLLALSALVMLGSVTFMMGGGVLGSLARTVEAAMPIVQLVNFPLMFLGGVFFPVEMLPEWIRPLIQLLPTSHLADSIRDVCAGLASTQSLLEDAAYMVVWLLAGMAIAIKTFRWE